MVVGRKAMGAGRPGRAACGRLLVPRPSMAVGWAAMELFGWGRPRRSVGARGPSPLHIQFFTRNAAGSRSFRRWQVLLGRQALGADQGIAAGRDSVRFQLPSAAPGRRTGHGGTPATEVVDLARDLAHPFVCGRCWVGIRPTLVGLARHPAWRCSGAHGLLDCDRDYLACDCAIIRRIACTAAT